MKIEKSYPNFKSNIKLVDKKVFERAISGFDKELTKVDYPWTVETMKSGKYLLTDRIMDCIAILLTNGMNSVLAHIAIRNDEQAKRDNVNPYDIKNIEKVVGEKVDLQDKNLHGIVLGGMQCSDKPLSGNTPQLNQIKELLNKYKIQFSIIGARRDVHYFGRYSLFYNQDLDTLFVTNGLFGSQGLNGKGVEMEALDNGKISYNTYRKFYNKNGVDYEKIRKTSGAEEFFQSQFREVKLNKLDSFI